tara:strand:- start:26535 stop:27407 length:873 start_codon:yes stop_codon:yes gene_type:complete
MKHYVKLLRIEQWLKNLTIFIPLIAYGEINLEKIGDLTFIFLYFSLIVSSTYVLNDIFDLESDLKHPTKNKRPIASGKISIRNAQFVLIVSLVFGKIGLFYSNNTVLVYSFLYVVTTLSYSYLFKYIKYFDILVIAFLFIVRLLVGSIALAIDLSIPLLLFVFFTSLGIVSAKKYSILNNSEIIDTKIKNFLNDNYKLSELDFIVKSSFLIATVTYIIWLILIKTLYLNNLSSIYLICSLVAFVFFVFIFTNNTSNKNSEEIIDLLISDKRMSLSLLLFGGFFLLSGLFG